MLATIKSKLSALKRLGLTVPVALRKNPYNEFIGRRFLYYLPFLLPHDKSYYGFTHLISKKDGLFLDVGANDGISALGFRKLNKDYRILSVEPNPYHKPALEKLKRRLPKFDYILAAAGEADGRTTIYVPRYKGIPLHTAASFSRDFARQSMSREFDGRPDATITYVPQDVRVMRLDDLNLKPDIIKIDTEGHDFEALCGLSDTVREYRPFLLVEFHPVYIEKIMSFLKERSYIFLSFDHEQDVFLPLDYTKELHTFNTFHITKNFFCIPQEKIRDLPLEHR